MKDFINKLKSYDNFFIYKYSVYDKIDCKLKIYYFSPDNDNQYISVGIGKTPDGRHECESGKLYFTDNDIFEDTPDIIFYIDNQTKRDFEKLHKAKKVWKSEKTKLIKTNFLEENLIL